MVRKFCLLCTFAIGCGVLPPAVYADLWTAVATESRTASPNSARFLADHDALRARLALAPHEVLLDRSVTIELPMPDGSLQQFSIVESPIMPTGVGARFPNMKSFRVRGIDDPAVSGRADFTMKGFRAMLRTPEGMVFIDPEAGSGGLYQSLLRAPATGRSFNCDVHRQFASPLGVAENPAVPANRLPGNYQTYRIAVSATQEYVAAVGGSKAAARAEILTAINRVNEFYERDLGIRLLLVANDGGLIESDGDSCFSNADSSAMLAENQAWIDDRIGSSAYDIGHVFSTGSGGVAFLGSACQNGGKAGGVTGLPNPVGDLFYIDFVAHEIGHQMNAEHSFNGTTNSCGSGNRNAATAFEPGSGSTIMGYAGICGAENLQLSSETTFHASSISQIDAFTSAGGSCHGTVVNGNTDPSLTPLTNRTIPANTPFRLNATASDADLDMLSYQWDQLDSGDATNSVNFGSDLGNNPLFRSFAPLTDSWRDFPALGTQLLGQTDKAEVLPVAARTLDLRVTVRDDNSGQDSEDIRLTVISGTGFRVTSPAGGTVDTTVTPYTITWNTANTENAPVSCANVDIDLLTFSDAAYSTYSVHSIAPGEPNDGSADVSFASSHPRARIRVKCSNNVFYDISDGDLNVIGTAGTYGDTAFTTFFNSSGLTVSREPALRSASAQESTGGELVEPFALDPARTAARIEDCRSRSGNGDASAFEPGWLLSLCAMLALVRLYRRYGLQ